MPDITQGEFSLEFDGYLRRDTGNQFTGGIGYGILPDWRVELEPEAVTLRGGHPGYSTTTVENTIRLLPDGSPIVLALFAAYQYSSRAQEPDQLILGPIAQVSFDDVLGVDSRHTLNLFVIRDVGHDRTNDTGLFYATQSVILWRPWLQPGIEFFGQIDNVTRAGGYAQQNHSAGPVVTGSIGPINYELGYQAGLTHAAPRTALRWILEYSIQF